MEDKIIFSREQNNNLATARGIENDTAGNRSYGENDDSLCYDDDSEHDFFDSDFSFSSIMRSVLNLSFVVLCFVAKALHCGDDIPISLSNNLFVVVINM